MYFTGSTWGKEIDGIVQLWWQLLNEMTRYLYWNQYEIAGIAGFLLWYSRIARLTLWLWFLIFDVILILVFGIWFCFRVEKVTILEVWFVFCILGCYRNRYCDVGFWHLRFTLLEFLRLGFDIPFLNLTLRLWFLRFEVETWDSRCTLASTPFHSADDHLISGRMYLVTAPEGVSY